MEKIYGDHVNLLTIPGEAFFHPDFFTGEESYQYFDKLSAEIDRKQERVKIFGDDEVNYSYAGRTMHIKPWTADLLEIKNRIESRFEAEFNVCLLNYYRDGKDSLGWHRDNEKDLGKYPLIAAVSFGASRIFQFRNYKDKLPIISIELTHGSLLIMKAETQEYWEQRLPKTLLSTQPRINLTFRLVKKT